MEGTHTTLAFDRDVKGRRYAEANIPEYWLWDLTNRVLAFPDLVLTPDGILPKAPAS